VAQAREHSVMSFIGIALGLYAAGPGCPKFFRSVPRPSASSFICEKLPVTPILGYFDAPIFANFYSPLGARCVRCSEIKGEPAKQAEDIRVGGYAVPPAAPEK
jgi:hypothetical protein